MRTVNIQRCVFLDIPDGHPDAHPESVGKVILEPTLEIHSHTIITNDTVAKEEQQKTMPVHCQT